MEKYQDREIIEKIEELVKVIKQDKLYQDYKTLRKKVFENKTIMKEIQKIKALQKKYVKSAFLDSTIEKEIEVRKKRLEEVPLYLSYQQKEEELNSLFSLLKEGLNDAFSSLLEQ